MLRPDFQKWSQTCDDLRELATTAAHPRTRERFLAMFLIACGKTNASQWATQIGRDDQTVMGWIHSYNARGPQALIYHHTGGPRPPFHRSKRKPSPPKSPRRSLATMACPAADGR